MENQPVWNDPELGAGVMVRGALWLVQEIGVGNPFTKEDIRQAFPGVAQADRRIRDLRDYGWTLYTRIEDASLSLGQTRFVAQGAAIWNATDRRAANVAKGISNKERAIAMARDDYMCTVCGISGADEYPDDRTQSAVLVVSRRTCVHPDGSEVSALATECTRCRAGRHSTKMTSTSVIARAQELGIDDRLQLAKWIEAGRRDVRAVEQVWSQYRHLPEVLRVDVRVDLGL